MQTTTRQLLDEVCPKIGGTGWLFYFDSISAAKAETVGLDVFSFYFLGRGGVLGDVDWPVVHSAFGYFKPSAIEGAWNAGRLKVEPRHAGHLYNESCQEFGRAKLSGIDGLEEFCKAALAVRDAAGVEGYPLFAGTAAEPLADDAPARAMQLMTQLREHRGGAHLLAVLAAGLRPLEAHYLARPEMMGLFGWSEDDAPEVGEEHRERLARAKEITDELVGPAYEVLDEQGAAALRAGADAIHTTLTA